MSPNYWGEGGKKDVVEQCGVETNREKLRMVFSLKNNTEGALPERS